MVSSLLEPKLEIDYPDSDGESIADNTRQFEWITTIKGGLDALFRDRDDIFVAGDLLWYPVEGDPLTRVAPDVLVAFGRPKGHRSSYRQWQEADVAPQVVFEVLSPGNTVREMHEKRDFYERFGVEEYYLYDPDGGLLAGWLRAGDYLNPVLNMRGWLSPQLGITFDLDGNDLSLTRPNGRRLQSYVEVEAARERAEARAERLAARLRELGLAEDEL